MFVVTAVGYRVGQLGPARHCDRSVTALAPPADWIAGLTDGLEEVMNSESLELQAIFNSDHLVMLLLATRTAGAAPCTLTHVQLSVVTGRTSTD